jgi:hypothetical protein
MKTCCRHHLHWRRRIDRSHRRYRTDDGRNNQYFKMLFPISQFRRHCRDVQKIIKYINNNFKINFNTFSFQMIIAPSLSELRKNV